MKNKTIDEAFDELYHCENGKIWELSSQFVKVFAKKEPTKVIEYLMKYVKKAEIHKSSIIKSITELVPIGQEQYAEFFRWAISENLGYYAVEGLVKAEGKKAFSFLIELLQEKQQSHEVLGKIVIVLAQYSGQPFDYDLPNDPAYWQSIPMEKILKWQKEDYPKGETIQKSEPLVKNPKTEMDFIVQRLENKLLKSQEAFRVGSMEYNRLVLEPASEEILAEISQKWQLPSIYLEFLRKYSPKSYIFSKMKTLQGARELIKAQMGYLSNAITGERLSDWDENWVVIAHKEGDPYIFDLSKKQNDDCPIYQASHGVGKWNFKKVANGFLEFLAKM